MAHHGIIALTVEVVVASDELAIRSAAATASEGYFNGGIGGELKKFNVWRRWGYKIEINRFGFFVIVGNLVVVDIINNNNDIGRFLFHQIVSNVTIVVIVAVCGTGGGGGGYRSGVGAVGDQRGVELIQGATGCHHG